MLAAELLKMASNNSSLFIIKYAYTNYSSSNLGSSFRKWNTISQSPSLNILKLRPNAPEERPPPKRSEEHTSELQSRENLVCRLLLEKKKEHNNGISHVHTR